MGRSTVASVLCKRRVSMKLIMMPWGGGETQTKPVNGILAQIYFKGAHCESFLFPISKLFSSKIQGLASKVNIQGVCMITCLTAN